MMNNRIVIFLGGYLPAKKYGGPVTSIANLVENLGDEFEFYIISNDHDLDEKTRLPMIQEGWNQVGKAKVQYLSEMFFRKSVFRRILIDLQPRTVYLSSVFFYQMNFPAIAAAKSMGIPIILATRGELNPDALRKNNWKKRPYLFLLKTLKISQYLYYQATSENEYRNIQKVLGQPCFERSFLLPNLPPAVGRKEIIHKEQGKIRLLSISRIVSNKNTLYSIRLLQKVRVPVEFDIYGPIEDRTYWNKCEAAMLALPGNVIVRYCGALDPDTAKTVYYRYDALLLPTQFENYGQVIAEALAHDCPVIISRNTTPWDDVEEHGAGFSIPIGKDSDYIAAIEKLAGLDEKSYEHMIYRVREYAEEKLCTAQLKQRYRDVFSSIGSHCFFNR